MIERRQYPVPNTRDREVAVNAWNLHQRSCQNSRRYHLWRQTALICGLLFIFGGCSTYRERIRTYIIGQEQEIAFPLRQVMLASAKCLTDLNLAISRVELVGSAGLIQAHGPDREATFYFRSMDPRHTRVHIDVFTEKRARDISTEAVLSRNIPALVGGGKLSSLEEMTGKMVPVHESPHPGSRVIGYLRGGTVVSIASEQKGWSSVALLSGGTGYIASGNLHPAPNDATANIPEA